MALLENPATTGLPEGIPYGVVPGNHDDPTSNYNLTQYFGVGRYCTSYPDGCRSYYGGRGPDATNDSNFTLFSASGMDFIVVNLEYNSPPAGLLAWADNLVKTAAPAGRLWSVTISLAPAAFHPGVEASFSTWGQTIYDELKDNPNLFLMMNGHTAGEGLRDDVDNGNTVYSLLADYQDRSNGGDGWLRILEFQPANNQIQVRTCRVPHDSVTWSCETDADSQFTLPYAMSTSASFAQIDQPQTPVASGSNASVTWPGLG